MSCLTMESSFIARLFCCFISIQQTNLGTPYLKLPDVTISYLRDNLSPSTGALPEPEIQGVENWLLIPKQENVTCHVRYHRSENVTFIWELDNALGSKQDLPGYMESVIHHRNNTATFVWVLNFTLDSDRSWYNKLRCVVRVDNKIHRNYSTTDERLMFYGMLQKCIYIYIYIKIKGAIQTQSYSSNQKYAYE